ncbi:unnamed protein product, partial [Discosporangium mesarthrocarpum]
CSLLLLLAVGSSPMGYGLTGRSASGQFLTWSPHSAPEKAVLGETRPVAVDGKNHKKIMIDEVIPAIKPKMPRPPGHTDFVQQDGAKPHTKKGVMEAIQAEAGNSIILETQPSNSPNLNVNDLSFSHSTQQLKEDVGVTTTEGLVEATLEAFHNYPRETLECIWHSLFAVYGEILRSKGDNRY